jgi:hypothetical protein
MRTTTKHGSKRLATSFKKTGCWRIISGDMIPPLAPMATLPIEGKIVKRRPDMDTWNYQPEDEDDDKYMKKYNQFRAEFERYRDRQSRACGTILGS